MFGTTFSMFDRYTEEEQEEYERFYSGNSDLWRHLYPRRYGRFVRERSETRNLNEQIV